MIHTAEPPRPFPELKAEFDRDPLALCRRVPGLWLVDKPSGPSSHDVVARMRRILGIRRVGHAGTLDPLASGLLVVMAGNASRLFDSIQAFPKAYVADFRLGAKTDSQDITGEPVPGWSPKREPPLECGEIEASLSSFRGATTQIPPMHSALKKNGTPLYKLARKGETVEREARGAMVYSLELRDFDGRSGQLEMQVSSGFYVRTLIDDLGDKLGCGAVMTGLRRTAIGPFDVKDADRLDFADWHPPFPPSVPPR